MDPPDATRKSWRLGRRRNRRECVHDDHAKLSLPLTTEPRAGPTAEDELTREQSRATYYVYRIDLKDGTPVYVGMGGGDLDRLERRGNHHNPKILSLIRDRLTRKPARVAKRLTEEEAYAVKRDLIRQYGRKDLGVGTLENLTDGSPGSPNLNLESSAGIGAANHVRKISDESRAKMSASGLGRQTSDETRAKISASSMGRVISPEARAKLSAANIGKKLSAEHKAKLLAATVGRKLSAEHKAKLLAINLGSKRSAESRAKIGEGRRGKKHSTEHRAKIAEGLRRSWTARRNSANQQT